MTTVWVGTYPADGLGAPVGGGEGIWRVTLASGVVADASQMATQAAPSFVVTHPNKRLLYAVEEAAPSVVSVYEIADLGIDGQPREVARVTVGGAGGCHLLLAPDFSALYVSNYATGELVVLRLESDGHPASQEPDQVWTHYGSGPVAARQESSHAHFACLGPGGSHVLVADLGTDEIRTYRIGERGLLSDPRIAATLPPGAGPRHLAVRGELIYVVCELDHQLRTLRWDRRDASALIIASQPTTLAPHRTGSAVHDAHVVLVERDRGDVLLVSVRGADVISLFDIAPEGELTYRAALDVGYWPRHFAVVGDSLIVGVEKGHEVRAYSMAAVLALAPETEAGAVASLPFAAVKVPSPACVSTSSAP